MDLQEIFRKRAERIAREPAKPAPADLLEVIEFAVGSDSYGIESRYVREVNRLKDITELPGTPPFVRGIISIRGRILSVLDLRGIFGLPQQGISDLNRVIVLASAQMEFGVLVDRVKGVRNITHEELQPSLPTLSGPRAEYSRGVTADSTVILDAERILNDEILIVKEEVI